MTKVAFVDLKAQYRKLKPEIDARIQAVLDHAQFVMGPEVEDLEAQLQSFAGAEAAITVSSGTDALLMALMALDIGPGDAVFLPSFTFTATAEVVVLCGASPVFVDVDAHTFNLDAEALRLATEKTLAEGALEPRAVIPVDLFGLPADYSAIRQVAEQFSLEIIADAAQSFGATLGDARVGSLARMTATSFFPAKPLGAYGDGGAIFCSDAELTDRLRSIRQHGKGAEKYEIVRIGINGRLDTIQAAILLAKLSIFPDELRAREKLASFYDRQLAGKVTVPRRPSGASSAWAQYSILSDDRKQVIRALRDRDIPFAIYYPTPMHLQPAYETFGQGKGSLPVSESVCDRILSLPMHPYLGEAMAAEVCEAVLRGVS